MKSHETLLPPSATKAEAITNRLRAAGENWSEELYDFIFEIVVAEGDKDYDPYDTQIIYRTQGVLDFFCELDEIEPEQLPTAITNTCNFLHLDNRGFYIAQFVAQLKERDMADQAEEVYNMASSNKDKQLGVIRKVFEGTYRPPEQQG